jgi:uncharacterized protein (DUF58 family)
LLTVGIGLAALNTGNNLLYLILGFLLASIVISGVLSERVIWDLDVRRVLPEGTFAHEPFPVRYELRRKRGAAFAVRVCESKSVASTGAFAAIVDSKNPVVVRASADAPRRGWLTLHAIEVSTTFPFGIFEKRRTIALRNALLVYPRRGFSCDLPPLTDGKKEGDTGGVRHRDGTADIADIRELHPLEDARRVHWKRSAAMGKLVVVEREREEHRQITLRVNAATGLDVLDRACEEAAGQTRRLLDMGWNVGLEVGDTRLRPSSGPSHERRILAALATAGFEEPR